MQTPLCDLLIAGQAIVTRYKAAKVWTELHRFLAMTEDGAAVQSVQGGECIGVSTKSTRGQGNLGVVVEILGFSTVEAGGQVRAGDEVISDREGRAIKDPQSPGSIVHIQGVARTGGVEGKNVRVELGRYRLVHPEIRGGER
ncbi:MAG TPA: hypothetical protein VM008_01950 [Phycisphaerae bacterium]|nr:hypothetical protein [Phycisphaerae bacterium]